MTSVRRVLAVGAVLAVLAPALLLAPAPPDGTYYGQWTAEFGDMAHYEGRVLRAAVAGIDTPSRRSRRSDALRAALGRDGPVEVTFVAGQAPPALAPVFSIFDDRRRRLFLLGVDGTDVAVHRWTRATTLRLDSPTLWWPGAMAGVSPGDTVALRFAPGDDRPCLTLNRRIECDTAIGADAGWTLLASPGGPAPGLNRVVGFLWMTFLGAMVGIAPWSTTLRLALAGLIVVLAVALPAALPHLSPSTLPALALGAGAGVGLLLGTGTGSS